MAHSHPTTEWDQLQEKFYRKTELYTLEWKDVDLQGSLVAGASSGGAIAITRDDRKIRLYSAVKGPQSGIQIYSASGKLIHNIKWDKGKIRGLGWSEDERLIVVNEDAIVRCYNLQGDFSQFSLGKVTRPHILKADIKDAETAKVKDCRFFPTGLVTLLQTSQLVTSQYNTPQPRLLASPPQSEQILSWTVIPPQSFTRNVEVLLATRTTILVADQVEIQDQLLQQGPFTHMALSPNGRFLALYTANNGGGRIWVVYSDFQKMISDFTLPGGSSDTDGAVRQVGWVGNDAVVVTWEGGRVVVLGPTGGYLEYFYNEGVWAIEDIDGVRIYSSSTTEFIQKVSDVSEDVFKVGSSSPSAVLLDAVDHLERNSAKADEDIRLIQPQLTEAVDGCIAAAGFEWDHYWQKQLLKAATFGKAFLELYNSDQFVDMCRTLRVLNAVRDYTVGLPLSYPEYQKIGPEGVIERLMNRRQHFLAVKICEYLEIPADRVYTNWACLKIRLSNEDEDTICRAIVDKLRLQNGARFDEAAKTAFDEGRVGLATKLLDYEPRAGKQVPLLLNMEQDEVALIKAIESGDTDLVFIVLQHLRKKLPLAQFFKVINDKPMASQLFEGWAKVHNRELLKDFYYQDDRKSASAGILIEESAEQSTLAARIDKLQLAKKIYSESKEFTFEAKVLEDAIRLLKLQESYDKELSPRSSYIGLSLNDTLSKLIIDSENNKSSKLQSTFKITDETFWNIKLRALVSSRRWDELRTWSLAKKPPIGYEPFVVACIEAAKWNEMQFYIQKCTTEKDVEKLKDLRGRNVKENIAKALDQHFADLNSKKGKR